MYVLHLKPHYEYSLYGSIQWKTIWLSLYNLICDLKTLSTTALKIVAGLLSTYISQITGASNELWMKSAAE